MWPIWSGVDTRNSYKVISCVLYKRHVWKGHLEMLSRPTVSGNNARSNVLSSTYWEDFCVMGNGWKISTCRWFKRVVLPNDLKSTKQTLFVNVPVERVF